MTQAHHIWSKTVMDWRETSTIIRKFTSHFLIDFSVGSIRPFAPYFGVGYFFHYSTISFTIIVWRVGWTYFPYVYPTVVNERIVGDWILERARENILRSTDCPECTPIHTIPFPFFATPQILKLFPHPTDIIESLSIAVKSPISISIYCYCLCPFNL